jgi:mevalonate kinase
MYKHIELSAPGKLILCGEHSVVYGYKALATSIDLRTHLNAKQVSINDYFEINLVDLNNKTIKLDEKKFESIMKTLSDYDENLEEFIKNFQENDLDNKIANALKLMLFSFKDALKWNVLNGLKVEIKSDIPLASGLGSSASFSVVLSALFLILAGKIKIENQNILNQEHLDTINQHAYYIERLFHGKPSGIDNSVSTYGKYILFEKGQIIDKFESNIDLPVLIVNSMIPKQTVQQVSNVRCLYEKHTSIIECVFQSINSLVGKFVNILKQKTSSDSDLKQIEDLININQGLLYSLQISNTQLNLIINLAREFNLSCKITGAGGGGCCFILLHSSSISNDYNELIQKLTSHKFVPIKTKLGCNGIKIENLI